MTSKNRSSQAEQSIDLHGLCVEDAIAAVEIALDRALLAGLDSLEIIHGKGSGELRKAVHKYLSGMPQVQRFALDPHNSGTTHIKL